MHKEIKTLKLYEEGGLIIKFKDGDHTYITPEIMKEISEYIIEFTNIEEDE